MLIPKRAFSFIWVAGITACVSVDESDLGGDGDASGFDDGRSSASTGGNTVVTSGQTGGEQAGVGGLSDPGMMSGGTGPFAGGAAGSGGDTGGSGGDTGGSGGDTGGSGGVAASGGSGGSSNCEAPAWQAGTEYQVGDIVQFEGNLYIAENENPGYDPTVSTWFWDPYAGDCDTGSGGTSSGGSGSGGSGGSGNSDPCSAGNLTWKTARKTNYTSYPDPGSEECVYYNGCEWAGWFAGCENQQSEEWVAANNVAAIFPNFGSYDNHDVCIRSGAKTMVVTMYDTCADSDCSGCCTQNQSSNDALIDLESYTNARWGLPDGVIEWADLGPSQTAGCE
jgi:hypothetical protein